MNNVLQHTEYVVRRKYFTFLGAKFQVLDMNGQQLMFSKQKAFKLKEDIRIFSDESMDHELLLIRARQAIDFSAAYDVVDSQTGEKVGALQRKGMKSLFRDSWEFLDAQDTVIAKLQEDSMAMAMLRRLLSNLIPQKYMAMKGEQEVATYKQYFNPFVYRLHVVVKDSSQLDSRLALAGGILLAAIEGRQK